jgi:hypothetical protein
MGVSTGLKHADQSGVDGAENGLNVFLFLLRSKRPCRNLTLVE